MFLILTPLQLNLALTYASRTQHHALARKISDVISNFGRERFSEEERENEDLSDVEIESDAAYMENRTSALRQRVQSGNGTTGSKLVGSSLRIKTVTSNISKFDHRSERQGGSRFLNNAHPTAAKAQPIRAEEGEGEGEGERDAANEMTKELFSDEGEGEGEEEDEEKGSEVDDTPLPTPLPGTKRTNPFKVLCWITS